MKRWEKTLLVSGAFVAAMLAVLPWIDRWFPAGIRMAPVVEPLAPESAPAEPLPEDPEAFSPETDAVDIDGQTIEPAGLPEPGEPAAAEAPAEPAGPELPEAIAPEVLPPPPPPTEP